MYKVNRITIYITLLFAFFLQVSVLNYLKVFGAGPDLVLGAVIFFGLFLGPAAGLESGIFAGFLKDLFALDFFGINIFIFGVTGLMSGVLNTKFFRDSKLTQLVLVFSFTAFSMLLHFLLVSVFSKFLTLGFWEYCLASVLPASIYTGIVSIPVFARLIAMYGLRRSEEFL